MGRTQRKRLKRKQLFEEIFMSTISSSTEDDDIFCVPALYRHLGKLGWKNDDKLCVRHFPQTGRGLCSKTNTLLPGDEIIRMPIKCLISIRTLEDDLIFRKQFDANRFCKDALIPFQALLAVYLQYHIHLKERSPLLPYIKSLPKYFTMPYFCPVNELKCLPESILECTVAQNRRIRDSFLHLKTVFTETNCECCGRELFNDIYTLDCFKWAYFAVNSRSVYVDSRRVKPEDWFFEKLVKDDCNMALAPFMDFFNHSDTVSTSAGLVTSPDNNDLEYILRYDKSYGDDIVRPYSEIYISYGTLSNFRSLIEYGFIIPNNEQDLFEFSLADIENFVRLDRTFRDRRFHSNKFKFIREHDLDIQMFIHVSESYSHNLRVVLHLLFIEDSHYSNVLSQAAFGEESQLGNIDFYVRLLIAFKINEFRRFIIDLERFGENLTKSGATALDYLQESINYLEQSLETIAASSTDN